MKAYHAELHGAVLIFGNKIFGEIHKDEYRRWNDGHPVQISTPLECNDNIVQTKNSSYLLVNPSPEVLEFVKGL